ncbi:MAG: flagellar assembly protein FliW [Bryobacterales bacterium]|nr:flagellar assembly protein FliW [Bryobacterales bacterium]
MASFATRQFGPVQYDDDAVVEFAGGLPAFERDTRFLLIERKELAPILFLQSLVNPDLCFATLPVDSLLPDYQLYVPFEELADLEIGPETPTSDLLCLAILTTPANAPATANLKAPVLIHRRLRRGRQIIQVESPYSFAHTLEVAAGAVEC